MADDKRIEKLEKENAQLRKDLDKTMRAVDRMASLLEKVAKRTDTAYHASRDAGNKINQINSTLRSRR